MNIEETKEYQQLCECYNVKKYEHYRQYNYAQVPNGLKELKKSQENGIECIGIKDKPTEFNDCVYWFELHYPKFTPQKQLSLLLLAVQFSSPFELRYTKNLRTGAFEYNVGAFHKTQNKEFSIALIQYLIDMSDGLDHAKVKEILEG